MNVTVEIKNLRRKLYALQQEGVGLLLGDVFAIVADVLYEQTGLQLKQDDSPLDYRSLITQLQTLYEGQLDELLKQYPAQPVRQTDLGESIREIKQERGQ